MGKGGGIRRRDLHRSRKGAEDVENWESRLTGKGLGSGCLSERRKQKRRALSRVYPQSEANRTSSSTEHFVYLNDRRIFFILELKSTCLFVICAGEFFCENVNHVPFRLCCRNDSPL